MQFILTKEELDNLVPKHELVAANKALDVAREMLSGKAEDMCGIDYCDTCPVSDIGGDKDTRPSYTISSLICKLPRNYSK